MRVRKKGKGNPYFQSISSGDWTPNKDALLTTRPSTIWWNIKYYFVAFKTKRRKYDNTSVSGSHICVLVLKNLKLETENDTKRVQDFNVQNWFKVAKKYDNTIRTRYGKRGLMLKYLSKSKIKTI